MSYAIKIEGLDAAVNLVEGFSERRSRAALATALTRTALAVRQAEQQAMESVLDRPNPYTRNSLYVITATGEQSNAGNRFLPINGDTFNTRLVASRYLQATVGIKDDLAGARALTPASKYLAPLIDAGGRRIKRFERALQAAGAMPQGWQAVPGVGASLDSFGNISRGQIIQILSQVGTELTAGHNRTLSKDPRRRIAALRRAGGRFFAVLPGQRGKLKPGIYQREFFGNNVTPVLIFVRTTTYSRIWDFYGIAKSVASAELPRQTSRAIAEHVARLKAGQVTP